jgi:hypothetical protein
MGAVAHTTDNAYAQRQRSVFQKKKKQKTEELGLWMVWIATQRATARIRARRSKRCEARWTSAARAHVFSIDACALVHRASQRDTIHRRLRARAANAAPTWAPNDNRFRRPRGW